MSVPTTEPRVRFAEYSARLQEVLQSASWEGLDSLALELLKCWKEKKQVFLCGNGGSAGNAIHLANDFLYGVSGKAGSGIRVHALPANASVLTCLGNDCGYDEIFSMQLAVQASPGDLLIVLSGSGNSPNIVRALEQARTTGMVSYAILGFSGGAAKALADVAIHFAIDDMQISEDLQVIVGHMLMQWLHENRDSLE